MFGVVVTPPLNEAEIMHAVFVNEKEPLLFIRKTSGVQFSRMSKQERKEMEKAQKNKSVDFGDWIEFEQCDIANGCIAKYQKIYPLNPSRSDGENLQIESVCVFPPLGHGWDNFCYCRLFGRVAVDPEFKNCFLADVAYRQVTRISSLSVSFGEYIDVAEDQNIVTEVPWNHRDPRFVATADSDSENDAESNYFSKLMYPYEVYDVQGVLISERNIYSADYPDVRIVLAYVKRERRTPVGGRMYFTAYYSVPLQSYVVRSYRSFEQKPFIVKLFDFGSLFLLEVNVKWDQDLPMGYLWSRNKELGLIYDSDGLLVPALLGKSPYASVHVYVADTGPSRLSRFSIKDLSDAATRRVDAVTCNGYTDISDSGLFLGNDSVLASRYYCLKIVFDENSQEGWKKLRPGTWIKFTAGSSCGLPNFKVKSWSTAIDPLLLPVRVIPISNGYAFKARGYFEQELSAVKSPIFGFIEIPLNKRSSMVPKEKGVTIIWVREDKANTKARFVLHSLTVPKPLEAETMQGVQSPNAVNGVEKDPIIGEIQPIVPCKRIECAGRILLQRCLRNSDVKKYLSEASREFLYSKIAKLLELEKPIAGEPCTSTEGMFGDIVISP
ncbi:unnamed protein product [Thelazia callipaeda]|uniref:MAM domain-containing protein n=1 Tax=Thelazia callipaeda TaxID=103827 RepID=A0A0N5D274_THECL|nr:unnamed protein product [Thelazia callipaeda]